MSETSYYRSRIEKLDEQGREFGLFFRTFGEDIQELMTVWQDAAGREVFTRCLSPQSEALSRMSDHLAEQGVELAGSVVHLTAAEAPAIRVSVLSEQGQEHLQRLENEARKSESFADLAEKDVSLAQAELARCHAILNTL